MYVSKTFEAKYSFKCACCNEEFPPGTLAYYGTDHVLRNGEPEHIWGDHTAEPSRSSPDVSQRIEVMPRGKSATDRCNKCFIVHSPGQDGCE